MKPAPFTYHRPDTLAATAALVDGMEDFRLLAGGQSLMPMMNMRYVMVDHLIDLNEVAELAGIDIADGRVKIGAMTRQRDLLASAELKSAAPVFAEALQLVGHLQTRNRGTIGGSLSHLDPAAELPGLAMLLDARIRATRKAAERTIAMADFPLGYMTPNLEPGEILSEIEFDILPEGHGYAFQEFSQRHGDFAIVGVGALMTLDGDGRIERVTAVLVGVDYLPVRLPEIEDMLVGETPSENLFRAASEKAAEREMMEDALIPESYRQSLTKALLRRTLVAAAERARG